MSRFRSISITEEQLDYINAERERFGYSQRQLVQIALNVYRRMSEGDGLKQEDFRMTNKEDANES